MSIITRMNRHLKRITLTFFNWLFHYSGAKYIYRKFNPPSELDTLPTGLLWVLGIYVAFFGIASQRYENRVDIIENRANAIFSQLGVPSVQKNALSRIARVQTMWCPKKPEIIWPHTPFISLFSNYNYQYGEMVAQLKETLEDYKNALAYVDFKNAALKDAELMGASLQHANLSGADLTGVNFFNTR
jgi:hypothetical protein